MKRKKYKLDFFLRRISFVSTFEDSKRMKLLVAIVLVFSLISLIFATDQPIIFHTKDKCTRDDRTGDYCKYEELELWPEETLKKDTECSSFYCTKDFDIYVDFCDFDEEGEHEWINGDVSKPFPQCCGEWVQKQQE